MKYRLQHDIRDCGAACLRMIAEHYGLVLSLAQCRELTKTERLGTNIYGLTDGAKKIGLCAEALEGTPEELIKGIKAHEITFPFIAHIVNKDNMLHYIVVAEQRGDYFVVGDPASGKQILSMENFFRCWTGCIVTFKKTDAFKPGNYTKGSFFKFFRLLKGQWRKMAGIFIASLVIAAVGILGAFVFQIVIDHFAFEQGYYEEHDHDHDDAEKPEGTVQESALLQAVEAYAVKIRGHFNLMFSALILLYLLRAVISFVRGWLIVRVYRTVDLRLTLKYYNHIVDLPMAALSVRQTGEYLSRFSDSASIRQAISGAALTLLLDSVMAVAGGVILFLESVQLFCVSFGMVILYAILVWLYRKPVEHANRSVMEEEAQLQSYFKESIDGIETVKASNAGEQVKEISTGKFHRFLNAMVRNSMISVSQDTLAGTVELIGTVLILWIGFSMVLSGQLTIGTLMTFYVLLAYFTEPIKNLIELQPTIQTAFVAADRLNDILELKTEQAESVTSSGTEIPSQIKCWETHHVDFRYGNRELTLHDVSIRINQGERIAIVGESGSGKTTLAKLFLRFYEPESGEVTLDGRNVSGYDMDALRKSIAYVGQDTFLFSDTVRNNLALGNPELTEAEMERICERSKALDFIKKLPLEYDTPLDENGINLSGGQRQRLAIARALSRHPQLLILDEATSHLDTVTENGIRDTLFDLERNMTCIIIAHRLTTIRSCNRIYVMKNGTVAETGTYKDLMEKQGEFYRLWNAM